jgi:rare lipoprotein A
MKKLSISGLLILFCLASCAGERHYVRKTKDPSKKLIVLPEIAEDRALRAYVVNGERYYPLPDSEGFVQCGNASWYGSKFHGRPTASSEIFDMYEVSAAHKTLPFGTYVKILNLSNKKQIIVRINDRGPFVKGRIIDLSYAAAKGIGLIGPGIAQVKVVALGREVGELESPGGVQPVVEVEDPRQGDFTIQVGAFRDRKNALQLADRLKLIFNHVEVSVYDDKGEGRIFRVRVSRTKTLAKAGEIEKKLRDMGFEGSFIVRL